MKTNSLLRPVDNFMTAEEMFQETLSKIKAKQIKVAVLGLGYVGLPLAVTIAAADLNVIGIDINQEQIKKINSKRMSIHGVRLSQLKAVMERQKFVATTSINLLNQADVISVCVPTPLNKMKIPDLSCIERASQDIARHLKPSQLIIIESTTYPGTTEEVVLPLLQASGFRVGEDFYLAFSPERIDPGNRKYSIRNTPKIVGGVTQRCTQVAQEFYQLFVNKVVPVSSPKVAETAKLFENVFRNVNIALVHELAILCDKMKINTWEVIEAAATKPFGLMRFNPGPGVGGHCIPVDPYYLAAKAKEYDFHSRFIELSGEVNENRPYYVVERVAEILNDEGISLRGANLLVVGITYKPDVDDLRESPVLKIMATLLRRGANLFYHDPFVSNLILEQRRLMHSQIYPDFVRAMDAVIIGTNHSVIDYELIRKNSRLIIDTRNCIKKAINKVVWV